MGRKYIFAGNWKMNHTLAECETYFKKFLALLSGSLLEDRVIVIAPPFTALYFVSKLIEGSPVELGAQNVHYEKKGAFTGEISPPMLRELGVRYVIVGHSERRHLFSESDELIAKRVRGAYEEELIPILCVGETLEERESGRTFERVDTQLREGLKYIDNLSRDRLVIAYEPVWAIGTGKNATPEQAEEVHRFIREHLQQVFGNEGAEVAILYGGSVTPENVGQLLSQPNIDGVLVGGASLDPEKFFRIVTVEVKKAESPECRLPDYSQIGDDLLDIVNRYKRIAIVGVSPKPDRPSFVVMDYLIKEGFQVLPVNPRYEEIMGIKTYPDLESIPQDLQPEVVIIFRKSSEVYPIVEKAVKVRPRVIWMQEGIENKEAKALAEKEGIKVVMNLCFKKVHQISKWKK